MSYCERIKCELWTKEYGCMSVVHPCPIIMKAVKHCIDVANKKECDNPDCVVLVAIEQDLSNITEDGNDGRN